MDSRQEQSFVKLWAEWMHRQETENHTPTAEPKIPFTQITKCLQFAYNALETAWLSIINFVQNIFSQMFPSNSEKDMFAATGEESNTWREHTAL